MNNCTSLHSPSQIKAARSIGLLPAPMHPVHHHKLRPFLRGGGDWGVIKQMIMQCVHIIMVCDVVFFCGKEKQHRWILLTIHGEIYIVLPASVSATSEGESAQAVLDSFMNTHILQISTVRARNCKGGPISCMTAHTRRGKKSTSSGCFPLLMPGLQGPKKKKQEGFFFKKKKRSFQFS